MSQDANDQRKFWPDRITGFMRRSDPKNFAREVLESRVIVNIQIIECTAEAPEDA
jgi:hypothetical protein